MRQGDLLFVRLQVFGELLQRLGGYALTRNQDNRRGTGQSGHLEVLERIVAEILVERRRRGVRAWRYGAQSIAVRRRMCDAADTDGTASARDVFDKDAFFKFVCEPNGKERAHPPRPPPPQKKAGCS